MLGLFRNKGILAAFLAAFIVLTPLGFASTDAYGGGFQRRRHSRAKGAIVGGIIGAVGGGLVGGRKGVAIGAGLGAGTGYLIQRHRNNRRYRYRNYRRYRNYHRY
jgi:hypothetical protein